MSDTDRARRRAVVMQPEDGASWWQPVPANGYAQAKLTPDRTGFDGLSMGYQTIAPHSRASGRAHGVAEAVSASGVGPRCPRRGVPSSSPRWRVRERVVARVRRIGALRPPKQALTRQSPAIGRVCGCGAESLLTRGSSC